MRDDVSGIRLNMQRTTREIRPITVQFLRGVAQLHYLLALFLAFGGVWFHRPRHSKWERSLGQHPYVPLIQILFLIAAHAIFFDDDRFHLPILPFIRICSSVALAFLLNSVDLAQRFHTVKVCNLSRLQ